MRILTREMVDLARQMRRRLRAAGTPVPALSDPELVERLLALADASGDPALRGDAGRLRGLVFPPGPPVPADPGPARRTYRGAPLEAAGPDRGTSAPQPARAQRGRRYYRGVPLDDDE